MKKIIGLILFVCLSLITYSQQNYLYIGEKKYPSTIEWGFACESCNEISLGVAIAKTSTGGYLQLSISGYEGFSGIVMIYLEDGTAIKCSDKGMKDNVDGKSIAIYVLTMSEISKLKSENIKKIRFNMGYQGFTAENKTTYIKKFEFSESKQNTWYNETAQEIKELFE